MSESILQKGVDVQALTTAILLPGTGLFADRRGRGLLEVGPLTKIGGISLFQRTVLTFQRAGINQLIVLAGVEEEVLKQVLLRGPRVSIPVRWMPIREFPLDDPRTWEALAAEVHGFCLIAGAQAVFSRQVIERLRNTVQKGQALVVARKTANGEPSVGRRNPALECRDHRVIAFHNRPDVEGHPVAADLVVLPAAMMGAAAVIGGEDEDGSEYSPMPIRGWLTRATADGRVHVVATDDQGVLWYRDVWDQPSAKSAERVLFRSLKGEYEGFVDRYFNRTVSRFFTKLFLLLRCSPNVITMVATFVGLLAAAGFAFGTYAAGIVAALLFQLSAVIDCCDGEVARLTFSESPFGAWLDITMDNVVHIAIFAGIAWGAYARQKGTGGSEWVPLTLGAAAIMGNVLSFWLVTKAQKIGATRGWSTPRQAAWTAFILKNVASRDFSIVILFFAIFDTLHWFLWMAACGSTAFVLLMLLVIRLPSAARA
jgi:phosphatidylglycerophosphate synthase